MFTNKALKQLLVPLIVEQILTMLVGIIDTVMVSSVGEAAISGVALVDMVNFLVITVLSAVATGGAIVVSQYLGSKDKDNANHAASQLLTITILISAVITGLCLILHRVILSALFGSVDADVMSAAITYFLITAASFPFIGIYSSSAALFRSMQETKVTMYVTLVMNVINVIGNAIGIYVFHAGVAGVAVPTLVSRAVAGVAMMCLAFNGKNEVFVTWKKIVAWNGQMIKRILNIAVPNGIENGLFMLGKVLVTSIVALFGTSQIAANGVAGSVNSIAIIVVSAVNLAMVTVVGRCVGAGEYEQVKYYVKKLMLVSYIATGVLSVLVGIALPLILKLYTLSDETYRLSIVLIIMHNILATALHPTSFNLSNALRASGDVRFTMFAGIGSMIVFRLGTAFLLGIVFNMGIIGVWIAMGMDWLGRSAAFVFRYRSGKWKNKAVI